MYSGKSPSKNISPNGDSFGELHFFQHFCQADQSVFRVGFGEALNW